MKTSEFIKHLQAMDQDAEVMVMHYDSDSWEYIPVAVPAGVKTDKSNLVLLNGQDQEQPS